MFLDRLENGFLLYETPRGFVRAEVSLRQRIYLLWTFRHFRQLSMPLLNSRQRELVNELFRHNEGVVSPSDPSHSEEAWPVIGVIENFVPPAGEITVSDVIEQKPENSNEHEEQTERIAEMVPLTIPAFALPKLAWSRVVSAVGALSLCIVLAVSWHRSHGIPVAQAYDQPASPEVNPVAPAAPFQPSAIVETSKAVRSSATTSESVTAPVTFKRASIAATTPGSARKVRSHEVASTAFMTVSGEEAGIQASRPPIRVVYPIYPKARVRGGVALTARLDSDGVVRGVRVVSGNRALAASAVRAVRQWRYRPYLKDGQAVATETNIFISFIAEDAISMTFPPSLPLGR
jgi:TonB family protein